MSKVTNSQILLDGATVKVIRESMKMSQAEFAKWLSEKLGTKISRSAIAMYETDKRRTVKLSSLLRNAGYERFKDILEAGKRACHQMTLATVDKTGRAIKDLAFFFKSKRLEPIFDICKIGLLALAKSAARAETAKRQAATLSYNNQEQSYEAA
jgi:transcriptional regulator with XRE-family HTH domain